MLGGAILCHTERFKWLYVKPRDTSLDLNYTPKNPFPYKKIGWSPVLSSLHRILSHQEPPSYCWWKKSRWYKECQIFAKVKAGYLSSTAEPHFGDNYYNTVYLYVLGNLGNTKWLYRYTHCLICILSQNYEFNLTLNMNYHYLSLKTDDLGRFMSASIAKSQGWLIAPHHPHHLHLDAWLRLQSLNFKVGSYWIPKRFAMNRINIDKFKYIYIYTVTIKRWILQFYTIMTP